MGKLMSGTLKGPFLVKNAVMYVTVPYNKVLFSILYFFNQPIGV
jgi:hypothetical protein